jgi:ATP-binding cassette, subfamily C (CFTR/MRP), member 1
MGYRKEVLAFADKRAKSMAEFIGGIRIIKYYGWENMVLDKILKIRTIETKIILKGAISRSVTEFISAMIPVFISIGVFGIHTACGNELTPALALTVLGLFNLV